MSQEPEKEATPSSAHGLDSFYVKLPNTPLISSADAERIEKELLEKLKARGPKAATLKPLAVFYSRVGQQETAYRYLKTWMKQTKNPEELSECLLMCGQLAEQVDQPKAALAFYTEGLQLDPKERLVKYYLHNNLAYCLNLQGDYDQGREHARQAIAVDPSRANAYKNLGVSLTGLKRYAEAAQTLIKAVHTDASYARALTALEELVKEHGEDIRNSVPDIAEKLEKCQQAAATAGRGRFGDWARGLTMN